MRVVVGIIQYLGAKGKVEVSVEVYYKNLDEELLYESKILGMMSRKQLKRKITEKLPGAYDKFSIERVLDRIETAGREAREDIENYLNGTIEPGFGIDADRPQQINVQTYANPIEQYLAIDEMER